MHFTMKDMIPYLLKLGQTDVILTAYNFSMPAEMGMQQSLAMAHKAGVGVIAIKVMAGGFARIQRGDRLYTDNPKELTDRLRKPGAMVASMKWVLQNQDVDAAIIGMADAEEVEEDVASVTAPLTDTDRRLLAQQLDYIRPLYCRMCGQCVGQCPRGLPVGEMLRVLSYADGYGNFPMARERFLRLPAAVRSVRCGDCDSCAVHCPNGVQVRDRLARAQELLA
jgi:predicted aldo/keto reductase-like oxidoreductase